MIQVGTFYQNRLKLITAYIGNTMITGSVLGYFHLRVSLKWRGVTLAGYNGGDEVIPSMNNALSQRERVILLDATPKSNY